MAQNPDHAPFYFSARNRPAQDANDPTVKEVLKTGTPTGETGREYGEDNKSRRKRGLPGRWSRRR